MSAKTQEVEVACSLTDGAVAMFCCFGTHSNTPHDPVIVGKTTLATRFYNLIFVTKTQLIKDSQLADTILQDTLCPPFQA